MAKVELESTTRPPSSTSFICGLFACLRKITISLVARSSTFVRYYYWSFVRVWMNAQIDCSATVWCIYIHMGKANNWRAERLLVFYYTRWIMSFLVRSVHELILIYSQKPYLISDWEVRRCPCRLTKQAPKCSNCHISDKIFSALTLNWNFSESHV